MIAGKTLFILVLLLLKSSAQPGSDDDDDANNDDEIEYKDREPVEIKLSDHENWMKNLDNNKLISDITIPGTHDAMALRGGPMAKCQRWPLEDQLKAGIRYLDLRVSVVKLKIWHGIVYQHISLEEVLDTIKMFLEKAKTEFVLVRIKPVHFFKGRVQNVVEDLIKKYDNIYKGFGIPKVGDVRGKIVLVQKGKFKLGITLFETDERGDFKVTKVTDKKNKITQHLKEANEQCKKSLSLVYSSGTSLGTYKGFSLLPNALAKEINPWLKNHLEDLYNKNKNTKPCFGIIAMDFPNYDLIKTIIKFNI